MSSDLGLVVFDAIEAFHAAASPFLLEKEAEYGLMLGLICTYLNNPPTVLPFMALTYEDGEPSFAALYTGVCVILTRGRTSDIEALVETLESRGIAVNGVVGPQTEVDSFSKQWCSRKGCMVKSITNQRIYEVREVIPAVNVHGSWRVARTSDFDLVLAWMEEFHREAVPDQPYSLDALRNSLALRIGIGTMFLWEQDAHPVAMAGISRPTPRTYTVNAVYTPPEHRRNGYATVLVAAISEFALSLGKEAAVLYTDLSNPTSNSIYTKIGYKPVCDSENRWFRYQEP